MTLHDHAQAFEAGAQPGPAALEGSWRMDTISTAGHEGSIAWLHFDHAPGGTGKGRYELMGIAEGLVTPKLLMDHFQQPDYAPLCKEMRETADGRMVGRFVTTLSPELESMFGAGAVGLFHSDGGQSTFYYVLERSAKDRPVVTILSPFLNAPVPDGVGMAFDEMMEGWYWPGLAEPAPGKQGDLSIGERVSGSDDPPGTVSCSFRAEVSTSDINSFVDGPEHQAAMTGHITFGRFEGQPFATFPLEQESHFRYQRLNPETGEAEMAYHVVFTCRNRRFVLDGVKYMQKDGGTGAQTIEEVLNDYTTVLCRVHEVLPDMQFSAGIAYLKFRTFENLAMVGNLPGFLRSFQVTGTSDPQTQFHARMRFLAFTAPYVQRKYQAAANSIR